ncbi:MAG: hypothetical protein ABUT11_02840 [Leifsonia sp.]
MSHSPAPRRGGLRRAAGALPAVIGLAAGMLGLAAVPAGAASMSLGSVPAVVSDYVSSGAMVTRLDDVYGPNASGTEGITFDDTTKAGPISRVYEWTAQRLANHATDHPVQLTNNWVVPITIGGKSVGVATIWINPQTVDAELAEFAPSAKLGTALTTVPATAALVRDPATGAWLALDHGTITALIAGKSGITKPVPVGSLKLSGTPPAPVTTTEPNTGLALAIGVVAVIVIVILVVLLMPRRRRRADAVTAPAAAEPATAEPAAAKSGAAEPATGKPATAKPATAKPATAKPAGPRLGGRTPTTSSAAKPAASKPTASRPAASKPPASKPPVQKQPPRPRTPKPPADPDSGADS